MPTLHTRFTEMFDLKYPVMSAPMTHHCNATLAGAVSAAGGLGSIAGLHTTKGPQWVREEIAAVRARTEAPFVVGFISNLISFFEPLFEAALDEHPPLMALSFGDPSPWIERCQAAGARVMCQVQTYEDADRAVSAGADLLVAQGHEAGGHTGSMGLLPFLTGVVTRHPDIPVLAAGGIGDGPTLAAALMAGAEGAWMGTAFLATTESTEVDDIHKQFIVASDGADTVFTRAYDILAGFPWPDGVGERVRRNRFTDEWVDREAELRDRKAEVAERRAAAASSDPEDPDVHEVLYGQSARCVTEVRSVADVLRTVCEDAAAQLQRRSTALLS